MVIDFSIHPDSSKEPKMMLKIVESPSPMNDKQTNIMKLLSVSFQKWMLILTLSI